MRLSTGSAQLTYRDRVKGSLLGGAVGDALGAGIEFDSIEAIRAEHGPDGVKGPTSAYGQRVAITDDTQMTLFTAEGLIRASVRADRGVCHPPSVVWLAYQRWLTTQDYPAAAGVDVASGWLISQPELHAIRAPGNACLSGLRSSEMGTRDHPRNPGSKGCGAVMRSAPFGWLPWGEEAVWDLTIDCAVLTHGHPSGYFSAAALALIIRRIIDNEPLDSAVQKAIQRLTSEGTAADETRAALEAAVTLATDGPPSPERVARLGEGWVGEEALAIAVYCAMSSSSVEAALLAAVNHSGDSDSTGAITGNIVGALHGDLGLPVPWVVDLDARGILLQVADDFVYEFTASHQLHGDWGPHTRWTERYPGV